jgi:hypothetical protein
MITPKEALRLSKSSRSVEKLEEKVDRCITTAAAMNRWPCTVVLDGEFQHAAAEIVSRYAAAGWNITFNSQDLREPPFLMISKPSA